MLLSQRGPKPLPQPGCWKLASRAQGLEAGRERRELGSDFCPINSPLPVVRAYVRGGGVCPRGMGRTSGLLGL